MEALQLERRSPVHRWETLYKERRPFVQIGGFLGREEAPSVQIGGPLREEETPHTDRKTSRKRGDLLGGEEAGHPVQIRGL